MATASVAAEGVAALVLAAGSGRRLGGPKALLRYQGTLLVERAVAVARQAECAPVVVVLGSAADQVQTAAEFTDATVVVNKAWSTGMASSLRTGLTAAQEAGAVAVALLPVDMPGLTAQAVRRVCAGADPDTLACGAYDGRRSYPVVLGRGHWPGVTTLASADVGVRPYLLARAEQVTDVACEDVADPADVDTPEEAEPWGIDVAGQVGAG